jgi:hypothetical protein
VDRHVRRERTPYTALGKGGVNQCANPGSPPPAVGLTGAVATRANIESDGTRTGSGQDNRVCRTTEFHHKYLRSGNTWGKTQGAFRRDQSGWPLSSSRSTSWLFRRSVSLTSYRWAGTAGSEGVEAYIGELEKENEQGPGPIAGMRVKQSQLYRLRSVGSPEERSRRSLEDFRVVIPGSSAASVIPLQ